MTLIRAQLGNVDFGRFRLVERLGEGGMAVVFRAIMSGPDGFSRSVVLKKVRPELSSDPTFKRMLLNEARLCAYLHHPAIVNVIDVCEVRGEYCVVMEYVEGVDLGTVLYRASEAKRPIPPGLVCYMVSELASALAYAHELRDELDRPLQIVHRDVTPSNIMITRSGAAKLLDFGVARATKEHVAERTGTGILKGKVGYLSPEQIDGEPLDGRADLFALGIVMWEALTLKRLFRGENDLETLRRVREAEVAPPSKVQAGVPAAVDAVLLRLLARNPTERYPSGHDVAKALSPLIHALEGDGPSLRAFLAELPQGSGRTPRPRFESDPGGEGEAVELQAEPTRSIPAAPPSPPPEAPATLVPLEIPRQRWPARAALVALSALVLLGAAVLRRPLPPVPRTVVAPVPPPAAAEPPPAVPAPPPPIRLQVLGARGAEVLVDGQVVGRVPLELSLPRASSPREVAVRYPGKEAQVRRVAGDEDLSWVVRWKRRRRADADEIKDPFR